MKFCIFTSLKISDERFGDFERFGDSYEPWANPRWRIQNGGSKMAAPRGALWALLDAVFGLS